MSDFEKTMTEYIDDLGSENRNHRLAAAVALGEWGDDRGVTPLIKALKHEDPDTRREAARALKEIGNRRAINPLVKRLEVDASAEVRAEAVYALGYFEEATERIDQIVLGLEDEHLLVRQNTAFALGKIKRRKTVRPLIRALLEDKNYNIREIAAWALGEIGDKRAIKPLIKALNDEQLEVRKNAVHALGTLEASAAVPHLKQTIMTVGLVKESAWALSKLLSEDKTKPLFKKAFKTLKKEKAFAECLTLTREMAQLDKEEAIKLLKDLRNERGNDEYKEEIRSTLEKTERLLEKEKKR